MRWQPYVGSVAIHALLIAVALRAGVAPQAEDPAPPQPAVELIDVSMTPPAATADDESGGGGGAHASMALPDLALLDRAPARPAADVPERGVLTGIDDSTGTGNGIGAGSGNGIGTGIGDGTGRGNGLGARLDPGAALRALPAPPPPPVSKARPAKLIHPTREMEVDEAELFAATVTVDETGDVVGARMMRSHPGSRGDTANSMIWQFRYAPALDDDGVPVKSTFVQTFAVR